MKQIENSINKVVERNPIFKWQDELLQSVPGVGKPTSVTFIAYTRHLHCLRRTGNLPALRVQHLLNIRLDRVSEAEPK